MTAAPDYTHKRYLDDLVVGDQFLSGHYEMTAAEIKDFAQRYDPQPFHLDEVAAAQSFFQGLAASGWHTAGVTMRLLVQTLPLAAGIVGAETTTSWPRPTRPGDVLNVVATLKEIKPSHSKPDRGMITLYCETFNQNQQVVQKLTAKLLVFRRPAA
ncbi:MaoC family dehydratase [Neisseriaceae bacterium CLB008]|nr:MaoC family dehydratase [Neisseriaceae bacterium]